MEKTCYLRSFQTIVVRCVKKQFLILNTKNSLTSDVTTNLMPCIAQLLCFFVIIIYKLLNQLNMKLKALHWARLKPTV